MKLLDGKERNRQKEMQRESVVNQPQSVSSCTCHHLVSTFNIKDNTEGALVPYRFHYLTSTIHDNIQCESLFHLAVSTIYCGCSICL